MGTAGDERVSDGTGETRLSRALLLLAALPAFAGLLLGNAAFLLLAVTLVLVVIKARDSQGQTGRFTLRLDKQRVQRGGEVTATATTSLDRGPGLALVHQPLPEPFHLARGSNLHLLPPGQDQVHAFAFASNRRGPWALAPATLELVHPLLLAPPRTLTRGDPLELTIEPTVRPLRTVKGIRGIGRDKLGEDRAYQGPASQEFQELRDYVKGDPLKIVNWKATAKASTDQLELRVNQYEPEARKNIWFFLDLDQKLEVGTTLHTALEDGIDIALALIHHFIGRGHRVGGCTFNGDHRIFYPDTGSRQELTIARALAQVAPGHDEGGLPEACERVKGFLARERPLVFVITRPEADPEGLMEGVRRIHGHTATARRAPPVNVLSPEPGAGDATDRLAQELIALEAKHRLQTGGTPYLHVHRIRDGARGLERALARGVLVR